MLQLNWHQYKYYPYEQQLAIREVETLLGPASIQEASNGIVVESPARPWNADRLVYFSTQQQATDVATRPTMQARLERINGIDSNRQATRYSAHGLHEYKGKFNPQIAKAILNIFQAKEEDWALDPFCGSGTSLLEAAHMGVNSIGTDINPMAVYLANAKIKALSVPAAEIQLAAQMALEAAQKMNGFRFADDERTTYLKAWFPVDVLADIERLRCAILAGDEASRKILLVIASNLLRDYSLQEPSDLRIRRRSSPMPNSPFFFEFQEAVSAFCKKIEGSQAVLGLLKPNAQATRVDCRECLVSLKEIVPKGFDVALTSPPYATALPYIDTQRLSLVWLGLIEPTGILSLEAQLVGSREIRGQSKSELLNALIANDAALPGAEAGLCTELQQALTEADGFRRQAVPRLLYRYFSAMANSFRAVREVMKPGAMYGLVVGGNHTVLGGTRFDINTPKHIANLASSRGWDHVETVELQTYKRYGLHAKNSGTTEALVILRA